MYEMKNIYLCEAATTLQRLVQYEVPALKKAITKAIQTGDVSKEKLEKLNFNF